ncbi:MAG: hypothetical protein K5945_05475 [Bacteroidaceae bacterium]|nr:hypothetical protein [Bacteroidaceae bacterium]
MKRVIFFILLLSAIAASAQRRRQKITEPVFDTTPEEAMAIYDFETAEEILEAQIEYLEKTEQPTEEKEALLEIVRKNMLKLHSTANVTIIDSVALPKSAITNALALGNESGTIEKFAEHFNQKDTLDRTVFINQLKNRRIYGKPTGKGNMLLYGQELIGNEWTTEQEQKGLQTEDSEVMNYPFMLTDGMTLYYAAKTEEGLGGYDIYMSRYDPDDHVYLAPENVGMPFNSPANDYLMCIDEYNNLGWFVSDRNQPADSACLYIFVPIATRRVYTEQAVGIKMLRNLARIHSLRDTWENKEEVAGAQKRLKEVRDHEKKEGKAHDFDFILNDQHIYTTLTDFRNEQARKQASLWDEARKDLTNTQAQLTQLRGKYASASNDVKQQLAPQIRLIESRVEKLSEDVKGLEKQIRQLELKN